MAAEVDWSGNRCAGASNAGHGSGELLRSLVRQLKGKNTPSHRGRVWQRQDTHSQGDFSILFVRVNYGI